MSLARNTLVNLAGIGVPLLVSVATVPLYLHAVGLERYGVLSICWVALAYFALFDFGVGKALSQRMAAIAHGPAEPRNALFWAGFSTSLALSVLATLAAFAVAGVVVPHIGFASPAIAAETRAAIPILILMFPLVILGSALSSALTAHERFVAVNLIEVASSTGSIVVTVAVAYLKGPELPGLIATIVLTRLAAVLALFACCWKVVPVRGFVRFTRADVAALMRFGGWISLSDAVTPVLSLWDRFAIGAVLGAGAVPIYSIPNTLVARLSMLPWAMSRALFPGLARADPAEAQRRADETVAGLGALMTPICLGALVALWPFLTVWIGPRLAAQVADLSYLFVPGLWMNALAVVPYTLVVAQQRPKVAALIHLGQVLPYALFLYLAMKGGGLTAVAVLWSVRTAADALLFLRFSGSGGGGLKAAWPGLALVCLSAGLAVALPPTSVVRWAGQLLLLALGLLHAARLAPPEVRDRARHLVARLRRRPAAG